MWNFLKRWLKPQKSFQIYRIIDFTKPTKDHWATFESGSNFDALFRIRGNVKVGDYIVVRMQSGRAGRFKLFSVRSDFTGLGQWQARGIGIGYYRPLEEIPRTYPAPNPKIKGLLGDGTRWVRSSTGELAHLPSGFTKSSSEFWEILVRDEACRNRANSVRATGNL